MTKIVFKSINRLVLCHCFVKIANNRISQLKL